MNYELKIHLIEKYRESIAKRYDFEQIKDDPELPETFTKEVVDELKKYFLENLYSSPDQREKLDEAFERLLGYMTNPSKIWGIIGSLTSGIFRFGLHFPAAIRLGKDTVQTHSAAREFEQLLLEAAEKKKYKIPLTNEQFHECVKAVPRKKVEVFIDELTDLFHVISDIAMLDKTIQILHSVLEQMKVKKNLYDMHDRNAIQLGIDILGKGKKLLEKYDDALKNDIITYVTYAEMKFLNSVHKTKKKGRALA